MPRRGQRSSRRLVSDSERWRNAAKSSSSGRVYTQKEYLPAEKQRLLELVERHGDDWKTIVRQFNAEYGSHGRKRTEDGLKNKHGRMKKEEEGAEMIRMLTGTDNLAMYGWGGASTASSQGMRSAQIDPMPAFESTSSSSSAAVDLAAYMPTPYVDQALDGVYVGCCSSDFGSSPLNLPSTPYASTDVAGSGYWLQPLDGACPGWSAIDSRSSLTEFRPASVDAVWPFTLANAPALGGGLDSLCVEWSADGSPSLPLNLCLASDALAGTAGLGDGRTTCGLATHGTMSAPCLEDEYWFWDTSDYFQAP